jgi:protein ImuB
LRTLGEFAALPPGEVAARLGHVGVEWQRVARGEDRRPLVPAVPEERFEQTLELDWPIDGLEPLSFVLGRLMEPLSAHLERRDRGAAVLHVRLHLVTRVVHERSLQLPAPMRDARALRTLALLDLESHPPDAAIDRVTVAVDPTPGRVVQFSLFTRPLPSPEHVSTLLARLAALMGEGRCGSPELVDSWRPGACAIKPFAPRDAGVLHSHEPRRREDAEKQNVALLRASATPRPVAVNAAANPVVALRRFRSPIPVRVRVEDGRPVRVWIDRRGFGGGQIVMGAGPWRTSGAWWEPHPWNRDEWDVALADGVTYRLFHERVPAEGGLVSPKPRSGEGGWFIEGVVD